MFHKSRLLLKMTKNNQEFKVSQSDAMVFNKLRIEKLLYNNTNTSYGFLTLNFNNSKLNNVMNSSNSKDCFFALPCAASVPIVYTADTNDVYDYDNDDMSLTYFNITASYDGTDIPDATLATNPILIELRYES